MIGKMEARKINLDEDYDTLTQWWKGYDWDPVPKIALPPTGLLVDGLAAGWLMLTDTQVGLVEWVVGNPEADPSSRRQAVDHILIELERKARALGLKALFTSVHNKRLIDRYTVHGYIKTDEGMTNMIKGLN